MTARYGGLVLAAPGPPAPRPLGIHPLHRRIARLLVKLKIWEIKVWMRMWDVTPREDRFRHATWWLYELMLRSQNLDNLHHAPCCPANHYCKRRLVLLRCTCGAWEVRE